VSRLCRIYRDAECPTPEVCRLDDELAPCFAAEVNAEPDDGRSYTLAELLAALQPPEDSK
jgi:hypothetical protein